MGFNRYLGFHFTDTCIYIAEARQKQDKNLLWDVPGKANYEVEPEWMPLYKDAIPNLFDNQEKLHGFSALPYILRDFSPNRYQRFDSEFLDRAIPGTIKADEKKKLENLFRYCRTYYIKPQPDEKIIVTMITDDMKALQRRELQTVLEHLSLGANVKFIDVIGPEEACWRFLWSENNRLHLDVEKKVVILLYMGYARTFMIPLDHQELVNQSAQAPGMVAVDRAVINYAVRNGLDKANRMDDELLLYAQLARRGFTSDQITIRILEAELPSSTYQEIIKEKVAEVANKLEKFIKAPAEKRKSIDEIFLVGEGAGFTPVVNAIQSGCNTIPLKILQPANHAAACGAASKSFFETNPDLEVLQ